MPDGIKTCEFISFRLRTTIFHFSPCLSASQRSSVVSALSELVKDKKVYVFSIEKASKHLLAQLDWAPSNLIDASEIAKQNGIRPSLSDMAVRLSGGAYCRRALRFPGNAIPSPSALKHIDVGASIIYEFCVEMLNSLGADFAAAADEYDQRRSRNTSWEKDSESDGRRSGPRSRSRLL